MLILTLEKVGHPNAYTLPMFIISYLSNRDVFYFLSISFLLRHNIPSMFGLRPSRRN